MAKLTARGSEIVFQAVKHFPAPSLASTQYALRNTGQWLKKSKFGCVPWSNWKLVSMKEPVKNLGTDLPRLIEYFEAKNYQIIKTFRIIKKEN